MSKYKSEDFKHYKVTWPNGISSTFSHFKAGTFGEPEIKNLLVMHDSKRDKTMKPVKVTRTK